MEKLIKLELTKRQFEFILRAAAHYTDYPVGMAVVRIMSAEEKNDLSAQMNAGVKLALGN